MGVGRDYSELSAKSPASAKATAACAFRAAYEAAGRRGDALSAQKIGISALFFKVFPSFYLDFRHAASTISRAYKSRNLQIRPFFVDARRQHVGRRQTEHRHSVQRKF
jgi:hypothetical protein